MGHIETITKTQTACNHGRDSKDSAMPQYDKGMQNDKGGISKAGAMQTKAKEASQTAQNRESNRAQELAKAQGGAKELEAEATKVRVNENNPVPRDNALGKYKDTHIDATCFFKTKRKDKVEAKGEFRRRMRGFVIAKNIPYIDYVVPTNMGYCLKYLLVPRKYAGIIKERSMQQRTKGYENITFTKDNLTLKQYLAKNGVSVRLFRERMRRGWDFATASSLPAGGSCEEADKRANKRDKAKFMRQSRIKKYRA